MQLLDAGGTEALVSGQKKPDRRRNRGRYSQTVDSLDSIPDPKELRRKVLFRALGSFTVLGPLLFGLTALTATWALQFDVGIGLFAGLAGILGAAGVMVTKLLVRGEDLSHETIKEMARRKRRDRERQLDILDRRLTKADRDPRPEVALRDLRALLQALENSESNAGQINLGAVVEIHSSAQTLFSHCVQSLRQTAEIWETARHLHAPEAKNALLRQREQLISEVQAVVRQLSQAVVGLCQMDRSAGSARDLGRLRDELDQSLLVARNVEERVRNLLGEPPITPEIPPVISSISTPKPEQKG